jgi:competence protein ComEA
MKNVLYVLIGLMVGFVLAGVLFVLIRTPAGQPVTLEPAPTQSPIVVQIMGEVVKPGVYSMPAGSRVQDAVEAAGGLLADADTGSLNLAARLVDGQQVVIPVSGSATVTTPTSTHSPFTVLTTMTPQVTTTPHATLVNINTASVQQLNTLPGIGPVTAQSIITYRQQNGPFQQIEDIMNVPGIGPATFDRIRTLITV